MSAGVIETLSLMGFSGWAAGAGGAHAEIHVSLHGEVIAKIPARDFRGDVRDAGKSVDGLCGFRFIFPNLVSAEDLETLSVSVDGVMQLPVLCSGNFDFYDLMFDGSYGRDTSIPFMAFLSTHYIRHNARRLEHLAALRLPLSGKSVVEFGAGVGDHTSFFLDRGCNVLATDARVGNLELLAKRFIHHPHRERVRTRQLDVEQPFELEQRFDVVHCYGLLYHIADAATALSQMTACCDGIFLLETKTDPRSGIAAQYGTEASSEGYHSFSGTNFRPSREWLHAEMSKHFAHVYWPISQPAHEEFARDFGDLGGVSDGWPRAIVIGSHQRIESDQLVSEPPAIYADY